MTEKLTLEQREWRIYMAEALEELRVAIVAINGPYVETKIALDALKKVGETAIDDEDIGPCGHCGEPIWLHAGDDYVDGEDERFCEGCVKAWNSPTPDSPEWGKDQA